MTRPQNSPGVSFAKPIDKSLREGVPWCWHEVRAVEMVLEEVAQEFDGEDPLVPAVRRILDKTRQDLVDLQPLLGFLDVEVDLPEPDEERVTFLRERVFGPRSSVD